MRYSDAQNLCQFGLSDSNFVLGDIIVFGAKDLYEIEYFWLIKVKEESFFEVISRNTLDHWKIILLDDGFYRIMHKNMQNDDFHRQTITGTLYDAVLYIVDHDEFVLRGRRSKMTDKEKARRDTPFWQLIDKYGFTG